MKKVLFLTNVIRRMGMMQQMLQKLQKENKLNSNCACHWITEQTVWDKSWEEKLKNTDFLLLKWNNFNRPKKNANMAPICNPDIARM